MEASITSVVVACVLIISMWFFHMQRWSYASFFTILWGTMGGIWIGIVKPHELLIIIVCGIIYLFWWLGTEPGDAREQVTPGQHARLLGILGFTIMVFYVAPKLTGVGM